MANERVQSQLRFCFKGQPVLLLQKARRKTEVGERLDTNHCTILSIFNLKIFDHGEALRVLENLNGAERPMSRRLLGKVEK